MEVNIANSVWHGAKFIVIPVLWLIGTIVVLKVLAWIVRTRRGY